MLYGTASGDQFGTPWARILLGFRCFASMPHGCVHRPCPPVMHLKLSPCPPPCAYYTHAFAVFLRVSKMLYGTASGDQFGTPWARILPGFRCFASMPHGRVHRPCPPTRLYVQLNPHALIIRTLLLCFYGFRRCCTAPPLGINLAHLGLEFCRGSAVSQARLRDAFIGHVHLRAYMSSSIPMRLLYAWFCFVFTGFHDAVGHRRLWG